MQTEAITTYISTNIQQLYRQSFRREQTQTGYYTWPLGQGIPGQAWGEVFPPATTPADREAAIMRFYEDIIAGLQREMLEYKRTISELLSSREEEPLGEYRRAETVLLSDALRKKWTSVPQPGLPLIDYEP